MSQAHRSKQEELPDGVTNCDNCGVVLENGMLIRRKEDKWYCSPRCKKGVPSGRKVVVAEQQDWHGKFLPGQLLPWKGENFVVCELKGHLMMLMNVKAAGKLKADTNLKEKEK